MEFLIKKALVGGYEYEIEQLEIGDKLYPIRDGAWNDIMNSCFYEVIRALPDNFYLCCDKDGEYFIKRG